MIAVFVLPAGLAAQGLYIVSGNGQIVLEQFRSNVPVVVQARNQSGAPMAGVAVSWSLTGNVASLSEHDNVTDSNGLASAVYVASSPGFGYSMAPGTITASASVGSATFQYTVSAIRQTNGQLAPPPLVILEEPTPENRRITGNAGGAVPGGVVVRVIVQSGPQSGQPIPNVGVRLVDSTDFSQASTASCNGPAGVVLTNASGLASCDVILPNSVGSTTARAEVGEMVATPSFEIVTTSGAACSYTLSPAGQSFGSTGGSGSFTVNTGSGCAWTATSSATWIAVSNGTGIGTATVNYAVSSNSVSTRTGAINVGGRSFTVTQSAVGTAPNPLTITTTSLPSGPAGSAYSVTFGATGGVPPYRWTVSGGAVPAGMGLNATTGQLNGTPAAAGTFPFTITVTDSAGAGRSQTYTLNITGPSSGGGGPGSLAIATTSFPNGAVGAPYSQSVVLTGGCSSPFYGAPRTSVSSGTLPPGLDFASHVISGTPTLGGSFSFTILAEDACLTRATKTFTIVVGSGGGSNNGPMSVTPTSLTFQIQQGQAEQPSSHTLALSGPDGLDFTVTGTTFSGGNWLSATPAQAKTPSSLTVGLQNYSTLAAGNYTGRISIASNATNSPVTVNVTLTVTAANSLTVSPSTLTFSLERGSSEQVLAVTSANAVSFQAWGSTVTGADWLSVTPANGRSPSTVTVKATVGSLARGTYTGAVSLAPQGGVTVTVPVTLNVNAAPELSVAPLVLSYIYQAGVAPPAPQNLQIFANTGNLTYEVTTTTSTGTPWLFTSQNRGTTPDPVSVSVNPLSLSPGSYQGTITVRSPDSPRTITVNVILNILAPTPVISAITNGATFLPGPVSPGEIVTIFGSLLGPTELAELRVAGGRLLAQLAETRVLFDDQPAPLIYVSSTQVSAIVPYAVGNRPRTTVRVEYFGSRSMPFEVNVTPVAPGLFMKGGTTEGAIVNQNGTVNAPDNGAERGSIILLYATGEGKTDPESEDGKLSGLPLPKPLLPVTVKIGGKDAEVLYAGAAPDMPAGVMQVNARVPEDVDRGAVPVVITVGTVSTQANATVTIK